MPNNAPPTIQHIETPVFRLPMRGALQWGKSSRMAELRHVLVRVCLSDGAEGMAEAPPRPTIYGETPSTICAIIEEEFAPRLVGLPVTDDGEEVHAPLSAGLLHIQNRLHEVKNNYAARGALDIAIHAALAEHRGLSLAQHLGAQQDRIRVSYILGIGDRDAVMEEAEHVTVQGVRVLKVKVGRDWQEDMDRITELRSALGPGVALYADANETMQAENAAYRLAQLAEMGLLYCEEPLPIEEIRARATLRAGHHLPIIADDSAFGLRELARELEFDTFDILNIKTARTGYTESLQMLSVTAAASKGCMVGSQASAGLGTALAAIFAALPGVDHASELSFPLKLEGDITNRPIPIENGCIRLADVDAVHVDPARLQDATVSGP
jgi:L-Ala-D/L-Glu epimerase